MEEIKSMVQEAQKYKTEDEEHRKRALARNEIDDLLYNMGNTTEERPESASVDETKKWLQNKELTSGQLEAKKKMLEEIIGHTSTK
jgi:L1 cell adhesion molecule like protein